MPKLYKNIRIFRESLGLNQKEFSQSLGMQHTTYNGYETGAREPKSDFWTAVALTYGVSIDYLMGFIESPYPYKISGLPHSSLTSPALSLARRYDSLDTHGKEMVDMVLDKETERMEALREAQKAAGEADNLNAPLPPTPEEAARAEADAYYEEVLLEKKTQAESSASPDTNTDAGKMA